MVFGIAQAQTETPVVTNPTFSDDSYVHVPLQFGFPFHGRTFTNSWMHSNGVVSFLDPAVPIPDVGYNPGAWAYCCGDRPTTTTPQYSYMIAPLWTDLYPDGISTFRTEGTSQYQKYFWNNLGEISNINNRNTFNLEIRPTGYIGINYTQINMNQTAWIGTVGNASLGEINEIFYGRPGLNYTGLTGWSMQNTPVTDACSINPLSSPTCPGYTQAMCSANPLFSTTCSGYASAYYSQQCSLNSLYDVGCPGYAQAYFNYQCSLDSLYSSSCPGYQQAYLNQQCSISPLYSSSCSGYQIAVNECSANPLTHTYCPSYQSAVNDCSTNGLLHSYCPTYALEQQLCSTDPLSNQLCAGFARATNECNSNQLLYNYCPAYTTTLASCSVNPQSNSLCPGYSPTAPTTASPVSVAEVTPSSTNTVSTGNSTVDSVVNTTATSTTSPTATVSLAPNPSVSNNTTVQTAVVEAKQETKKEEPAAQTTTAKSDSSGEKETGGKKTARQEIAERRAEVAKRAAVEAGKNASEEMNSAPTLEAQVKIQNVVIQAMGFTPGFDAYSFIMPDGVGYKPFAIYKDQKTVDNTRMLRGLTGASDRLHTQMVDAQYK
jgi:hypothetical protein